MQVDEDWQRLAVGITAIAALLPIDEHDAPRPVPLERWDIEDVQRSSPVALEARFGAFVKDADLFDGAAFSVSRCGLLQCHSQSIMSGLLAMNASSVMCSGPEEGLQC